MKSVLVIAVKDIPEALRVANGLSISNEVKVACIGKIDRNNPDISVQIEAMEFAEVPLIELEIDSSGYEITLGDLILESDHVIMI